MFTFISIFLPKSHNAELTSERIKETESLLNQIPAKYCFITGSFLFKERYNDIDVFVVSRTKKQMKINNKKVKITVIDFNELYSLFYHSISKCCIAKNLLPQKPLKVTMSDYWSVINEAIPTLLNQKDKFHKNVRFLMLYTEFFRTNEIMDTFQLSEKINSFKSYKEILEYIKKEVPVLINTSAAPSYVKRFFYTYAAQYKELRGYDAQNCLYELTHAVTKKIVNNEGC